VCFGAEGECEGIAQKVGTTILFRFIHSGDINQPRKTWVRTTYHLSICIVRALYSTPRISAHSTALHTKKYTEYN